ncbi:uncharacterized protein LOC116770381 [Danaus plexippus]|uniref:uncharacterized protein LOC116770381 n=1 Tax=Danaus plexippus TaxID=13037 RepID=UPI002AB1EB64|nr:uncharacterized protein LOC116770381 [Danaus plexippus]
MSLGARKFIRVTKILLAGVTVFCVSWIASVNEWHSGASWTRTIVQENMSTMRTIVGYSEAKQAELDKPSPVSCKRLPAFAKIPHINRTWYPGYQTSSWQRVEGTSVSLYSAYYDERLPQKYIRILAMFRSQNVTGDEQLFCQTRSADSNEDSVEVVAAKPLEIWWKDWDNSSADVDTPQLLSCPLTEPLRGRFVVSIVTQPCDDPSNGFYFEAREFNKYKRNFTICVKDVSFQKDISYDLIEWIETNRLLGVDIIDIYIDSLNETNEKVLLNYRSQGFVRLYQVPIKYKSDRSLWQRRRDHIITYNDCLYRNIIESKFIVPLDMDEILLPKISHTWPKLIKRLTYQGFNVKQHSAVIVRNVFFFDFFQMNRYKNNKSTSPSEAYVKRDDVRIADTEYKPSDIDINNDSIKNKINIKHPDKYRTECGVEFYLPKLTSHIVSSAFISPIGRYSKSIMVTKRVLTAFNHYPLASIGSSGIPGWAAPFKEVQLNHYKESCNSTIVEDCDLYSRGTKLDRSALRLSEKLLEALSSAFCSKLNII